MLSDLNEPTNLGNPEEISILELGRKILEITRSRSNIVYKPLPEDDPKVRRPDIARARETLCWNPKVDLGEGLTKTLQWFRNSSKCSAA